MPGILDRNRLRGGAAAAAFLPLVLAAGGCSSNQFAAAPSTAGPPPSSSSFGITSFFAGSSARSPQTVAGNVPDLYCPPVQVRQGASTLTIAPPGDNSAMSVKYQASFIREGRQCAAADGSMVMKVGVQGRVLVGPGGGPGEVDVPLRIAIVNETPSGTTPIMTKFISIPLVVASKEDSPLFTHIEDVMSFPLPPQVTALYTYKVYVGFDPLTAQMQEREKEKATRKPRPKAKHPPKPKREPTADSN